MCCNLLCLVLLISCFGWYFVMFLFSLRKFLFWCFVLHHLLCTVVVIILLSISVVEICLLVLLYIKLCVVLITFEFQVSFVGAILLFILFVFTNLFLLCNDYDKLCVEDFCVNSVGRRLLYSFVCDLSVHILVGFWVYCLLLLLYFYFLLK